MRLEFLQPRCVINLDGGGGRGEGLQRTDEIPRGWHRKMRGERGTIGPLLDENQPQRVLAIDMHGMRDATRLCARTMDVFETEFADFVQAILSRRYAAGH